MFRDIVGTIAFPFIVKLPKLPQAKSDISPTLTEENANKLILLGLL